MKPKQKKPPAKKSASKSNTRLLLVVFTLMTIAIINLVVIRTSNSSAVKQRQLVADKASFALVEAEMAKAYEGMVQATGKPDVEYKDTGCGRTNLKFKEGALFCNIIYTFAYGEDSSASAYQNLESIKAALSSTDNMRMNNRTSTSNINAAQSTSQSVDIRFERKNDLTCNLYLDFSKSQNREKFKSINSEYSSIYQFRCSKNVISPVYTLAE